MQNDLFVTLVRDSVSRRLAKSVQHSIDTLRATPEDKLDYKPSETSNSVRQLAQHIIQGNNYCLQGFGIPVQGNVGAQSVDDLLTELHTTGEALVQFAESRDQHGLAEEASFFGSSIPTFTLLLITEWHLSRHAGQIDYLQTTWGDLEDHQ